MLRFAAHGFIALALLPSLACNASSNGEVHGIDVSPDGKLLAVTFVINKSFLIYRIPLDTGRASRITQNESGEEGGVAFSPDGKLMAYSYVPIGGHQRIVVMNVDGSSPRSFAESGTANLNATFDPTGTTIYFARSYPPPHYHEWDIFAMRLDGSDVRQLTHGNFYHISKPSISSDGKSMVLLTEAVDGQPRITVYSLEHPEKPTLSLQPHVPAEPRGGPIFANPQYLPDGKSILFMAASDGKHGFDYDIYRLEIATGLLDRLTTGNGFASDLCVFPDGKTAMFQKWHSDWHGTPDAGKLYWLDVSTRQTRPFVVSGLN